jgi:hypothetical protein
MRVMGNVRQRLIGEIAVRSGVDVTGVDLNGLSALSLGKRSHPRTSMSWNTFLITTRDGRFWVTAEAGGNHVCISYGRLPFLVRALGYAGVSFCGGAKLYSPIGSSLGWYGTMAGSEFNETTLLGRIRGYWRLRPLGKSALAHRARSLPSSA